jgi:hypothetical protein
MDKKLEARGSARIFDLELHDHAAFAKTLTRARQDYEVKWWWKYGQPRIDAIRAILHVKEANLAAVVTDMMELNHDGVQATIEVFPLGIPKPDMFQVELKVNRGL